MMKTGTIMIAGASFALLIGSPALGASSMRDHDRIRGAEWDPDRAVTQNLPSPQYRSGSFEGDRSRQSRDQFRRTPDQYDREFNRYRQDRDRQDRDRMSRDQWQDRRDRQNRYSDRREDGQRTAQKLKGNVLRFQENHIVVNTREGDRQRLHVNEKTLFDRGIERGDQIIAYVRPDGHAIAVRKDRGRQGEQFVFPGASERGDESRYNSRSDRRSYQDDYKRGQQRSDRDRYRP
jgi:hypothetical protein